MQITPKSNLYYYVKMTKLERLENMVTVGTEPERYVYILIPGTCEYYLIMANTVIKLRSLQGGIYPGLSGWVPHPLTSALAE